LETSERRITIGWLLRLVTRPDGQKIVLTPRGVRPDKSDRGAGGCVNYQGCREYGDSHGYSHGYGYGMGMETVVNPHGPVRIVWGFWLRDGNALNMR